MKIVVIFLLCTFFIISEVFTFKSNNLAPPEGKIGIGKVVKVKSMRYIVALKENDEHFGTAFFISQKHVLTAAECLRRFFTCGNSDFPHVYAWVGSNDLMRGGEKYYFDQVEAHKGYDYNKRIPLNNIGLITLIIPENTRKRITWIDLSEEDPKPKLFGQVTGWGPVQSIYRRNIFEFRRLLQSITVDIKSMNRKFCADTVNKQFPSDQKLFCAYNINNAVHFPLDESDIGTAFVYHKEIAIGILSFLPPKGGLVQAGIYTNINQYSEWIDDARKDLSERANTTELKIARFENFYSNTDLNSHSISE